MNDNQIYTEYRDFIYRFLLKYLKNKELAEEITQETFYQAIKSLHQFDPHKGTKFSSWLCQIALNLAKQALQKNSRQQHLVDKLTTNLEEGSGDIEADYIVKERLGVLYDAISMLKYSDKEIVLLRIENELSFKEIGAVYGKSENWARVTYYRAKQKLIEVSQDES